MREFFGKIFGSKDGRVEQENLYTPPTTEKSKGNFYPSGEKFPIAPDSVMYGSRPFDGCRDRLVGVYGRTEMEEAAGLLIGICQKNRAWGGVDSDMLTYEFHAINQGGKERFKSTGGKEGYRSGLYLSIGDGIGVGLRELADKKMIQIDEVDGKQVFYPLPSLLEPLERLNETLS